MGLYPLLTDNTCYLLAADFDKVGWRDAVKAMADICKGLGIPHAIEVSRSGNGAHLWIFFSEPVLAREARLLGFGLLDRAMEIYPDLSFDSYDRLFPNQDVMPEGGFGNLIALPLQYHARRQGNSQFVDANLSPYPDQWEFLSQLGRLTRNRLTQLMEQFSPRLPEADDSPPWEQGFFIEDTKILDVPKQLTITLANHLYFGLDEMPSKLTARLKRLASLSNPVFFKTQAMRFSTHGIPRYITCAKIEQGYLSLPRGCFDDAMALLEGQDIAVEIQDKREFGRTFESVRFMGELRRDQKSAVTAITAHDTGILHAPTAFGKTVTAIGVIVKRRVNTLILTHTRQLLTQWRERIRSFLTGVEIGTIGAGKRKPTTQIDIATYQSLMDRRNNSVSPIVGQYGQVIIDECHHISAPRFDMVLSEVRAKYVLGLTATPHRQDGHQKIVFMLAGPVRHKVRAENKAQFQQLAIVNRLHEQLPRFSETPHISDIYRWLTESVRRNRRIVDDVAATIESERHPLVLTERREHAERLAEMLSERGFRAVVLRGAMRAKESKAANEQLPAAQVIVATGKYIGEGFDLPRLDTLFLVLPVLAYLVDSAVRSFAPRGYVCISSAQGCCAAATLGRGTHKDPTPTGLRKGGQGKQ
uniref:Helicase conserved C-terminal domain-containing protein n=1 Tax=Candidatus Kentrum sp. TUN TaxID=2126343 RepID=A0A451A815_9GAMM|nr:MAG: Helicase conserved C-terminal domain-containing protein [Candidatus Kentron sp. TUN]